MIPSTAPLLTLPADVILGAIIPQLAVRSQIFSIVSLGTSCKRLRSDCAQLLEALETGKADAVDDPNLKAFIGLEFRLGEIWPRTPAQKALFLILGHAKYCGEDLPSELISPAWLAQWNKELSDSDALSASLKAAFALCKDKLPGLLKWSLDAELSEPAAPDGFFGEAMGRLFYVSNRAGHFAQMLHNDETLIKTLVDASFQQTDLVSTLPRNDIMALLNDQSSKGNSSNSSSNPSYLDELVRQLQLTPQVEPVIRKKAKRKKKCALM